MQFDKLESFVLNLFQSRAGSIPKDEILNKSQQSDLGTDEKNILSNLPNRSFNKDELMNTLKTMLEKQGISKIGSIFKKAA